MICPTCGGAMTLLFISSVCDRCDVPRTSGSFDRGYIVWRSRPPGSCEYVFKSRADAERWRAAAGLTQFPIRPVLSRQSFRFRRSTGSVRDIELADRLFEIFPDGGHEPGREAYGSLRIPSEVVMSNKDNLSEIKDTPDEDVIDAIEADISTAINEGLSAFEGSLIVRDGNEPSLLVEIDSYFVRVTAEVIPNTDGENLRAIAQGHWAGAAFRAREITHDRDPIGYYLAWNVYRASFRVPF